MIRLQAGIRGLNPGRDKISLLRDVQTDSGVPGAPNSISTGDSFKWLKRSGHEVDHSPPSSAYVTYEWSNNSASHVGLCFLGMEGIT